MNINYNYQEKDIEVGTMYCIGRNYALHAREMGAPVEERPVVFLKPPIAYINSGSKVIIPSYSVNMHYEAEVVVVIGKDCSNIEEDNALDYVEGIGIGIDFTLRDIQTDLKTKGLPWALAKSFKSSAPVSELISITKINNLKDVNFSLELNGRTVQRGNTKDMIFSIPYLISFLSKVFTLRKGDCIFTGTPEGVGRVNANDRLLAKLENIITLELEIGNSHE